MSLQTRLEALATAIGADIKRAVTTDGGTSATPQVITGFKSFTERLVSTKAARGSDFELSNPAGSYSVNAAWNATSARWEYITTGRAFLLQHDNTTGDLRIKVAISGNVGQPISWLDRGSIGENGLRSINSGGYSGEAYSDANPPQTFTMIEGLADGDVTTPQSGLVTLYTTDGKSLKIKDNDGVVTTLSGAGGGGGASGPELAATTDYVSTIPTNPATGLKIYSRFRARRLPSFVGPTGVDSALQPAFFSNRIGRVSAINGTASPQVDSLPLIAVYGGASGLVSLTTTSFFNSMTRNRYTTAATANSANGFRLTGSQWFLSTDQNRGGFFWVMRFGINAASANSRCFVGLSATSAAEVTTADPTGMLNRIGFGFNSTGVYSTNWYFHAAGASASTANVVDLGSSFPARTYATNFFEFRIFAPATSGNQVFWSATRLNDGVVVQGGPVTTNIPAVNTLLTHHAWINNVTAAAASMDFQSLYIETDN